MNKTNFYTIVLACVIIFLCFCSFLINYFFFKFPSNNYFPANTFFIGLILVLFYLGLINLFGKDNRLSYQGLELIYFFLAICLIALATNAVQLTPFTPIDEYIINFELFFHINMLDWMQWLAQYPKMYHLLESVYDSLAYQMCIIPFVLILMGRFRRLKDYYFLLLFTTLFGFTFYYFFPTTAPASVLPSKLFTLDQVATGLKYKQIHSYNIPSTRAGGLIALPSFHVVWALLCVYLVKEWYWIACIVLAYNLVLIISCVLLGWHYPSDVVAALILLSLSYYCLKLTYDSGFCRAKRPTYV